MLLTIAIYVLSPAIATVAGVAIYMYFKDHNPPHFHAKEGGDEAVYDFEGNTIKGKISPKKSKKVKKWAEENRTFLEDQWDEFQK